MSFKGFLFGLGIPTQSATYIQDSMRVVDRREGEPVLER